MNPANTHESLHMNQSHSQLDDMVDEMRTLITTFKI